MDEKKQYQDKVDFYENKIKLTENRISILENLVKEEIFSLDDELKANSYSIEILTLHASLESLKNYWGHYSDRLKAINESQPQ